MTDPFPSEMAASFEPGGAAEALDFLEPHGEPTERYCSRCERFLPVAGEPLCVACITLQTPPRLEWSPVMHEQTARPVEVAVTAWGLCPIGGEL